MPTLNECVSHKLPKLLSEGYERDQALAIAYSLCREKALEDIPEGEVKAFVEEYKVWEAQAVKHDDLLIAFGTAIKALDESGRVGGHLIVWGSPAQRDLQGEWFDRETNLELEEYTGTFPAQYHHGLDLTLKATRIGVIDTLKYDDVGVWAEAQLNLRNKYVRKIKELIDKGLLAWSSGSMPHQADIEPSGHIKYWPIYEGSATPAPAEFRGTHLTTLKAFVAASGVVTLRELAAKAGLTYEDEDEGEDRQVFPLGGGTKPIHTDKQEDFPEMDVQEIIRAILQSVIQATGVQLSEEQQSAVLAQVTDMVQKQPETEGAAAMAAGAKLETPEQIKQASIAATPIVAKAVTDFLTAQKQQQQAFTDALNGGVSEGMKNLNLGAGGVSKIVGVPGTQATKTPRITVRDERFDHLQAPDMALGLIMLQSLGKDVDEDYLKAMAYKTAQRVERGDKAACDLAVKSLFPFDHANDVMSVKFAAIKANEIMGVGQTGFGAEYAVTYYSTDVWEIVRQETVLYERMRALGMDEQEVPQGYKSDTIPLEGADMAWYNAGAGATDMDASSGRATPTTATSQFATSNKEVTLGRLTARTFWQMELEQDSIVGIVQEANRKIRLSGKEQIESVFINGDTDVTANTNINLIDGTPAAAPNKPAYTLFNGLLKLPLVTNTANRYDALNTLNEQIYLNLLPLLGTLGKGASDPNKILFLIDNPTYFASLNLAILKTQDVFPTATIVEGVLRRIWGVEVVRSPQMVLANAVGKVPAAGSTLGRIGLVRPDQWASRWKRKLEIFTEFDKDSYVTSLAAHMRLGLGFRDNEASACAVNVNVAIA